MKIESSSRRRQNLSISEEGDLLWWLRQKKHCVEGKEDPNKAQLQQLAPGN